MSENVNIRLLSHYNLWSDVSKVWMPKISILTCYVNDPPNLVVQFVSTKLFVM